MASINEIHYLITVASSAIAEFIQTYKQAREDSDDAIRESAAFIARALQEHAVSGLRSSASLISPWRCWSARYNQDCGNCLRLSSDSAFTAC